jgi:ABC-2 type transport system permease protein
MRLYGYFLRFSFSRAMEFRVDFFLRIFMDIFYYAINIGFYQVVFLHTDVLGGWDFDQMLVFIAGFLVIDAISMTVFANNLWLLPDYINKGDLDYYLVRPVEPLFVLSLRDFAASSFVNLLMACGIMVWALLRYPHPLGPGRIALFVVMILLGSFLRYLVRMLSILPTFWLHSARGFESVFFHLNRFIERPDRIFTGWVRVVLTTVLPFGLMASFPARLLLDSFNPWLLVHFFVVSGLFFYLIVALWKRGLRAYSSASS